MMHERQHFYPPNWKQLSFTCKEIAGWRCQRCHIRYGATRKSRRTGLPYHVWLHAAHKRLHETLNPSPDLLCLCPTCHGRYDYRLHRREGRTKLEILKHRKARLSRKAS
jgi:predicted HNH restriction endonuclease